jgi:ABC-2 type transport system ATP-binding protein
LVANTTPSEARAAIAGRIHEGSVAPGAVAELSRNYRVTQSMLVEGRTRVRILSDRGVPPGFEPVTATLEDAYLVLVQDARDRDAMPAAVA